MNSFELTKAKPPKRWSTPLIWAGILLAVGQIIAGFLAFILLGEAASGEWGMVVILCSFSLPLIGAMMLNKFLNKRSVEALGFHKKKWFSNYLLGVVLGFVLILFTCGGSMILGTLEIQRNSEINWSIVIALMVGFMIQGMTEEVICRGYVQNGLRIKWGLVGTMIIQGAFFTLLHAMNPGITLLPVINLFLYGVFIGMLFYYTDNLWLVGGLHSAWNFLLGPVIGIEVSGLAIKGTVFKSSLSGPSWLTGGSFGIEGSVLTTIATMVGTIIVYYLIKKKQKVEGTVAS